MISGRLLKETQPMEAHLLGSWIEKLIHKRDSGRTQGAWGSFVSTFVDPGLDQLFSARANTD
jgi:hypothetical protein